MPLLEIAGVDACQRSFCIAFAFLSGEEKANYIWVLNGLRSVYEACGARHVAIILTDRCLACMNAVSHCFPDAKSLLCLWHANKAVLRHCLPGFMREDDAAQDQKEWKEFYEGWHELMASLTEEAFKETLTQLKERYATTHTREVGYIIENWLDPHKEKLVKAYVDKYPHFENVVTSRGEGIHQLVKAHLRSSQLDLFEAWRSIKRAVRNQVASLHDNQAKQRLRTPIELAGKLYDIIRGWVSHEALRKVEDQRKLLQ